MGEELRVLRKPLRPRAPRSEELLSSRGFSEPGCGPPRVEVEGSSREGESERERLGEEAPLPLEKTYSGGNDSENRIYIFN